MKTKSNRQTMKQKSGFFRILQLFFRRELTILDFDQANFEKAVSVLKIHRMKEVSLHIFHRKSWRLFSDPSSGWSYDIISKEFD